MCNNNLQKKVKPNICKKKKIKMKMILIDIIKKNKTVLSNRQLDIYIILQLFPRIRVVKM